MIFLQIIKPSLIDVPMTAITAELILAEKPYYAVFQFLSYVQTLSACEICRFQIHFGRWFVFWRLILSLRFMSGGGVVIGR